MTPTQRTLDHCRKLGWAVDVAERWQAAFVQPLVNDAALARGGGIVVNRAIAELRQRRAALSRGVRKDLFGFVDIVALTGSSILAIQACAADSLAARQNKILTQCEDNARAWLNSGGRIEVWGWRKYKQAVERRFWRPVRREIVDAGGHLGVVEVTEAGETPF